ncbi:hypothetical protein RRSWK_00210 [Rhodopirellula sp. SWK7]|nr:hypothetical protein RRSWK_00210 [Rhodopirellula sp. SWK7]
MTLSANEFPRRCRGPPKRQQRRQGISDSLFNDNLSHRSVLANRASDIPSQGFVPIFKHTFPNRLRSFRPRSLA